MRKTFILALAAILATSALAGCASKDTNSSSSTTSSVADSSSATDSSSAAESETSTAESEVSTAEDEATGEAQGTTTEADVTSTGESTASDSESEGSQPSAVVVGSLVENAATTEDGTALSGMTIRFEFDGKYCVDEDYFFADNLLYSANAYLVPGTMTDAAEIIADAGLGAKISADNVDANGERWAVTGLDDTLVLPVTLGTTTSEDVITMGNGLAQMASEYPDGVSSEFSGSVNFEDAEIVPVDGEAETPLQ